MARGETLFRQWRLLKTLQAHRFGISTEELAERLECTMRTVQRDLSALQTCEFPISFEERDFGKRFWKIADGFLESPHFSLSMMEMLSLFLGQQLLAPLAGTQFGDGLGIALQKIRSLLPRKVLNYFADLQDTILVKNVVSQNYSGQAKEIAALNEAALGQKVVKVVYGSLSQGRDITGFFQPYGMVLIQATLYCVGCFDRCGDDRTLKVSRIKSVQMTEKTFERPANFSLAAYTHGSFGIFGPGRFETIRVKFTDWAATEVREQQSHSSQTIVKDTGGHLVAQFELSNTIEFKRWLLGFGQYAVVLKPRKLAAEVARELASAASGYGPGVRDEQGSG
ncbi:MAG: WYL domain-containing protein [Phycisphaerae bacterium]|jgi:predicted DNA-binding transcriptional regulator YafY